jgi:hypothetical protein
VKFISHDFSSSLPGYCGFLSNRSPLLLGKEGGRTFLPTGKQYSTISRFIEDADAWLQEAWSIVLAFDEPPAVQGNPSIARARFLGEQAPVDRLKPGHACELYEGKKKVAMVKITG